MLGLLSAEHKCVISKSSNFCPAADPTGRSRAEMQRPYERGQKYLDKSIDRPD